MIPPDASGPGPGQIPPVSVTDRDRGTGSFTPGVARPDRPPRRVPELAGPPVDLRDARPVLSSAARAWWTVAGMTVLLWGFQLFGYVDIYPIISLAVVVLGLWGLGTIVAVWHPRSVQPRTARALAGATLGLSIGAFLLWAYLQVLSSPAYGTDEIAFDQYAAQLARHGMNPYTHSMAQAFSLFHVSPDGYTFLLNGHTVTSLSYPALSFLLYVPFLIAGWSSQLAVGINVLAWAGGVVLTFVLLPRPLRPLAIVVGSFSVYISYAVGGVTDALFVPLLIGAVYRWDRFATTRGPAAWRGPVLLGLAMAVKQTPWLVLPFLVVGIALEARRLGGGRAAMRTAGRYVAIAVGAFLVPNLWFIAVVAPGVAVRRAHPHRQPHRARRPGARRAHPLPRPGRWLARGLHRGAGRGVRRAVGRLHRHLPGAEAVGGGLPGGGALLFRPVVRQLPGHPAARRAGGRHLGPTLRRGGTGRHRPPRRGATCDGWWPAWWRAPGSRGRHLRLRFPLGRRHHLGAHHRATGHRGRDRGERGPTTPAGARRRRSPWRAAGS